MKDCRDCGYCQRNIDPRHFIKVNNEICVRGYFDLHCTLFNGYMASYQVEVCPYFMTPEDREYQEEMSREFMLSENDVYIPF